MKNLGTEHIFEVQWAARVPTQVNSPTVPPSGFPCVKLSLQKTTTNFTVVNEREIWAALPLSVGRETPPEDGCFPTRKRDYFSWFHVVDATGCKDKCDGSLITVSGTVPCPNSMVTGNPVCGTSAASQTLPGAVSLQEGDRSELFAATDVIAQGIAEPVGEITDTHEQGDRLDDIPSTQARPRSGWLSTVLSHTEALPGPINAPAADDGAAQASAESSSLSIHAPSDGPEPPPSEEVQSDTAMSRASWLRSAAEAGIKRLDQVDRTAGLEERRPGTG